MFCATNVFTTHETTSVLTDVNIRIYQTQHTRSDKRCCVFFIISTEAHKIRLLQSVNRSIMDDNNDEEQNEDAPVILQHRDAGNIAPFVQPKTDLHVRYMNFGRLTPIDYHARVRNPDDFDRENTFVWVLLLSVRMSEPMVRSFRYDKMKKPRYEMNEKKYRRMYTFASLISNGGTLVMFEMSSLDAQNKLNFFSNSRIGDQFAFIEPDLDVEHLADEMPVINSQWQTIPAYLPYPHLIPEVPIQDDVFPNTSKFFVFHGARIAFDGIQLKKTCCTSGNLCDLRKPTDTNCPCWHQYTRCRSNAEYVFTGDIRVSYTVRNQGPERERQLPKVHQWSSQFFTEFVFERKLPMDPLKQESNMEITTYLRHKLRSLLHHVNEVVPEEQRGWTVIGWYRRSMRTDAATSGADDNRVMTNLEDCKMHIVRIQPTFLDRDQLRESGVLLPVWCLGETADMDRIRRSNRRAQPV